MKRVLLLLALSSLSFACGDDDETEVKTDGGTDASVDSGTVTALVTNTGAACTAATDCQGPKAQCGAKVPTGQTLTGGYCTAACTSSAECGANAACPLGELIRDYGATAAMGLTEGQCWTTCTTIYTQDNCRPGYICTNLATATGNKTPEPRLRQLVCLPYAPTDGGVSDASVADAAGLDASR